MSKVTKSINWIAPSGAAIEVKIEVSKSVEKNISYSDGWNVDLGNKVVEIKGILVYVNGKCHETTYNNPVVVEGFLFSDDYKAKVKAVGGYARLTDNVIINQEKYNMVMSAIISAETELEIAFVTENADQATKEIETKKLAVAKEIETAKKVIEDSMTQTEILSAAAEKQWRTNYNNINNEGEEGYVPTRVTLEDIKWANQIIKGGC